MSSFIVRSAVMSPSGAVLIVASFSSGLAGHPINRTIQVYTVFTTNVNTR
jgi:hypothetical protein